MEQVGDRLFFNHVNPEFDAILAKPGEDAARPLFFSHNEEPFVRFAQAIRIPSFAIHHEVSRKAPDPARAQAQRQILEQLQARLGPALGGMRYFFDATDPLRLGLFQILKVESQLYLQLLKFDLANRPAGSRIVGAGSNDQTPVYDTDLVAIESDIIPVGGLQTQAGGGFSLVVEKLVSETWVGETGRGYFVQGIWLDREITKFFSRLFLPQGKRLYPYYPVNCKFRSVCLQPYELSLDARRKGVWALHQCRRFLKPHVARIEQALRNTSFADDLPLFRELQPQVPPGVPQLFASLQMRSYLNSNDMKEYELSYETK